MENLNLRDSESLRAYLAGDRQAMEPLIRRHVDMVYATALRGIKIHHDAEDITQAVFALLLEKAAMLNQRGVEVGGWLYQTTRFFCTNIHKCKYHRKRYEHQGGTHVAESRMERQDPLEHNREAEEHKMALQIDDALESLQKQDRHAVILHYLENRSFAQVGQALGISSEAARKRTERGLQKMRLYLIRRNAAALQPETLAAQLQTDASIKAPGVVVGGVLGLLQGGVLNGSVAVLLKSTLHAMMWAKAKIIAATVCIATGLIGLGGFATVEILSASESSTAETPANPLPQSDDPETLRILALCEKSQQLPPMRWNFTAHVINIVQNNLAMDATFTGKVFFDSLRFDIRTFADLHIANNRVLTNDENEYFLRNDMRVIFDGQRALVKQPNHKRKHSDDELFVYASTGKFDTQLSTYAQIGTPLMGQSTGSNITGNLIKNITLARIEKREKIGDAECILIRGRTDEVIYQLWIDPAVNYGLRQWSSTVTTSTQKYSFSVNSIKYQQYEGYYIPISGTTLSTLIPLRDINHPFSSVMTTYKLDNIVIHPDFTAMKAFMMEGIPEGHRIIDKDAIQDENLPCLILWNKWLKGETLEEPTTQKSP